MTSICSVLAENTFKSTTICQRVGVLNKPHINGILSQELIKCPQYDLNMSKKMVLKLLVLILSWPLSSRGQLSSTNHRSYWEHSYRIITLSSSFQSDKQSNTSEYIQHKHSTVEPQLNLLNIHSLVCSVALGVILPQFVFFLEGKYYWEWWPGFANVLT